MGEVLTERVEVRVADGGGADSAWLCEENCFQKERWGGGGRWGEAG